jgi:ABC-type antimicrobial peptide transport system permease subunit
MKFGNLLIPLPVVIIVIIMIITAYIMSHIAVVRKVKNLNMLEKIKEQ